MTALLKKKRRIGFDFTPFVYGRAAGYNEYALSLIEGLVSCAREDCSIILFVRQDQRQHFISLPSDFEVVGINVSSVVRRVLWQNLKLPFIGDIDFFVFTGNFAPLYIGTPYLLITHDLNYKKYAANFSALGLAYRRFISKRSVLRAAVSVTGSEVVREEISNEFGRVASVVYNPVRVSVEDAVEDRKIVVCPTSLALHKNAAATYDACMRFAAQFPDVKFYFIGNWAIEDFPVKQRIPNIELLGYVDDAVRSAIFASACCILTASVYEGFGMPYAEAMLMNKSLICSNIPIANEVAVGYPFYIEAPFDADAIYSALCKAYISEFSPGIVDSFVIDRFRPRCAAKSYLELINEHLQQ
ncbi:glycosyltransferase [Variovorax sp. W2I14]|uniref:glycosyltransferase n=1 Tax=Variovorax sp. W2I14 TaxID=3042290 RepID=UPI003D1F4DE8